LGAVFPLPGDLCSPLTAPPINVVASCVDSVMFFAVCDFAALHWAALCAARVTISAAVSSTDGDIGGRERPHLPPSCRGSAH
jgi:hypothetical protein